MNDSKENGLKVNDLKVNGLKVNSLKVNGLKVNDPKVNGLKVNGLNGNGPWIQKWIRLVPEVIIIKNGRQAIFFVKI